MSTAWRSPRRATLPESTPSNRAPAYTVHHQHIPTVLPGSKGVVESDHVGQPLLVIVAPETTCVGYSRSHFYIGPSGMQFDDVTIFNRMVVRPVARRIRTAPHARISQRAGQILVYEACHVPYGLPAA